MELFVSKRGQVFLGQVETRTISVHPVPPPGSTAALTLPFVRRFVSFPATLGYSNNSESQHGKTKRKVPTRHGNFQGEHRGCSFVVGETSTSTRRVSLISDNLLWPFRDLEQHTIFAERADMRG